MQLQSSVLGEGSQEARGRWKVGDEEALSSGNSCWCKKRTTMLRMRHVLRSYFEVGDAVAELCYLQIIENSTLC